MSSVCRLCLGEEACVSICESLAAKILYCCALEPRPADGLPETVCQPCVATLHLAAGFKAQCERSHQILSRQAQLGHVSPQQQTDETMNQDLPYLFFMHSSPPTPNKLENDADTDNLSQFQTSNSEDIQQSKKLHPCHLCDKVLTRRYDLRRHVFLVHSKDEGSKCNICGKITEEENYAAHLKSHEDVEFGYECDICESKYFERRSFIMHLENNLHRTALAKHPERVKDYKCEKCAQIFAHKAFLVQHERRRCNDHSICTMCYKVYYNRVKHLRKCNKVVELKKKYFVGSKSPKPVIKLNRIRHLPNYKNQFFCAICITPFREKSDLKLHLEKHEPTMPCYLCYEVFENPLNLNEHMKTLHKPDTDVICLVCKESIPSRALIGHLETHYEGNKKSSRQQKKNHHCEVCLKSFSKPRFLLSHCKSRKHKLNVMINQKEIVCDLCDAVFKHSKSYKAHRKSCIL